MCPVCIAAAALIAGKVTSTGGAAAIAIRKFGVKRAVGNNPASNPTELSGKENAARPNLRSEERSVCQRP